jgi:transcriptional regulator with GAF, ATPase, and Fis domain
MKPIEEVTLLYEITNALNEHLDLRKSLYKVLDILSSSMNMVQGTITILNPLRNEINIEVAHGLTQSTMNRVKYKLGEGITGKVIETGKAVSIPKISEEPLFLNRSFWIARRRARKNRAKSDHLSVFRSKRANRLSGRSAWTGLLTSHTRSKAVKNCLRLSRR